MATERPACGLSSFLSLNCRDRAEAFARRLQSRLRSLGNGETSTDNNEVVDCADGTYDVWREDTEGHCKVTNRQPERSASKFSSSSDSDLYFDFDLDSPGSPAELNKLPLNLCDDLQDSNPESGCVFSSPVSSCAPDADNLVSRRDEDLDSNSSDGMYFDPENSPGFVAGPQWVYKFPHESLIFLPEEQASVGQFLKDKLSLIDDVTIPKVNKAFEYEEKKAKDEEVKFEDGSCDLNMSASEIAMVHKLCNEIIEEAIRTAAKELEGWSEKGDGSARYSGDDDETATITEETPALATEGEDSEEGTDICDSTIMDKWSEDEYLVSQCEVFLSIDSEVSEKKCPEQEKSRDYAANFLDVEDDDRPRVRRSSSLKSGKTPPGTPSRKKIVRFADVLGLDLADVRTFLDEIPRVPSSAFSDLRNAERDTLSDQLTLDTCFGNNVRPPNTIERCLIPLFSQPGGCPNFMDRVKNNKVCLENAFQGDGLLVSGTVRVINMDFNKTVHIRYTLDSWQSFADLQATYIPGSCDGFSDKFSFILYCHTLDIGQKVEFAVRFQAQGSQFWDNNNGLNYVFECLASAPTTYMPIESPDERWLAYF